MLESGAGVVVLPVLVACKYQPDKAARVSAPTFAAVAGVEDHVRAGVVQARLVPPYLARLAEHPVLVAALVVAGPKSHRLVQVLPLGRAVYALVGPLVADVATGNRLAGNEELWVDVVKVPLETFTLQVVNEMER